jgi:hypothetical protein
MLFQWTLSRVRTCCNLQGPKWDERSNNDKSLVVMERGSDSESDERDDVSNPRVAGLMTTVLPFDPSV